MIKRISQNKQKTIPEKAIELIQSCTSYPITYYNLHVKKEKGIIKVFYKDRLFIRLNEFGGGIYPFRDNNSGIIKPIIETIINTFIKKGILFRVNGGYEFNDGNTSTKLRNNKWNLIKKSGNNTIDDYNELIKEDDFDLIKKRVFKLDIREGYRSGDISLMRETDLTYIFYKKQQIGKIDGDLIEIKLSDRNKKADEFDFEFKKIINNIIDYFCPAYKTSWPIGYLKVTCKNTKKNTGFLDRDDKVILKITKRTRKNTKRVN